MSLKISTPFKLLYIDSISSIEWYICTISSYLVLLPVLKTLSFMVSENLAFQTHFFLNIY